MRFQSLIMAALLTIATLSACSIRKHDEIECGLSDGSSFILRAEYDWYPLARLIPHAAERLNSTGFTGYYRAKGDQKEDGPVLSLQYDRGYRNIEIAKQLCSMYGLINEVPYVALSAYRAPGSDDFISIKQDPDLFFGPTLGGKLPPHVLEVLAELDAGIGSGAIVWHADRLVLEKRVIEQDPPHIILAVYRVESLDGGQTWINPHITTKAEAFELGKSFDEQCFIARLVRIDDRRFEPHFPPCPVSGALPR